MNNSMAAFFFSLFLNIIIIAFIIITRYFILFESNILKRIPELLFIFSIISYFSSICSYEEKYIWYIIGKKENLEKNDKKINKYLSHFVLYIITTISFIIILIFFLIIFRKYLVLELIIELLLSIFIGHLANYPMKERDSLKNNINELLNMTLCMISFALYEWFVR